MHMPQAFLAFLVHFHGDRDYFECHEWLEGHWKQEQDPMLRTVWLSLIQVAVGMYHFRRDNRAGALKSLDYAIAHAHAETFRTIGIDGFLWEQTIRHTRQAIANGAPYGDVTIPLCDPALLEMCQAHCRRAGYVWGQPSNLHDETLIHRHLKRDRTAVIAERLNALQQKIHMRSS